ncbi:MAG: ATP-binding protein [Myxococcota bacterium]|nr:ATP-binding protein [Myxococcota bacterium]
MKNIELDFVCNVEQALASSSKKYIQVVIGPRQVGKTTGIRQLLAKRPDISHAYCSADGILSHAPDWLYDQWTLAKSSAKHLLVIDEVQKVENWSEVVKQLWDAEEAARTDLQLVLLGSGSLTIQRGLTESLAGRYQLHRVSHWNVAESNSAYGLSLEDYLVYGGYPGSYPLIGNTHGWLDYIKQSIIEPVIGKDILSNTRVKSPALFKQCFDIICSYPAQEISYTKLLGQLQDRGNTDLVKYYLELFEGAFLVKQLFKYAENKVIRRSSSPKLLPLCPALYSAGLDADLNEEERGRSFELTVGAALSRLPGQLYYWRERNFEVDFVYRLGKKLFAVEVKSGRSKRSRGLLKFKEKFREATALIVTPENYERLPEMLDT